MLKKIEIYYETIWKKIYECKIKNINMKPSSLTSFWIIYYLIMQLWVDGKQGNIKSNIKHFLFEYDNIENIWNAVSSSCLSKYNGCIIFWVSLLD